MKTNTPSTGNQSMWRTMTRATGPMYKYLRKSRNRNQTRQSEGSQPCGPSERPSTRTCQRLLARPNRTHDSSTQLQKTTFGHIGGLNTMKSTRQKHSTNNTNTPIKVKRKGKNQVKTRNDKTNTGRQSGGPATPRSAFSTALTHVS